MRYVILVMICGLLLFSAGRILAEEHMVKPSQPYSFHGVGFSEYCSGYQACRRALDGNCRLCESNVECDFQDLTPPDKMAEFPPAQGVFHYGPIDRNIMCVVQGLCAVCASP